MTTWGLLDERVDRLAGVLRDRGVGAGDRVAILCGNRPEMIETLLAAWRLGAIAVPLNTRLSASEVAANLDDAGVTVVIADGDHLPMLPSGTHRLALEGSGSGSDLFEEEIGATPPLAWRPFVADDDPALILYTSGTTGRSKGAVLSHTNLAVSSYNTLLTRGITRRDEVSLLAMPLFHIGGLTSFLPYLMIGASFAFPPEGPFDPAGLLDVLESEAVTSCVLVPSQWQALCAQPGVADRRLSLRRMAWSASSAPQSVLALMGETFPGVPCYSSYGQTEMSSVTTLLGPGEAVAKRGSVGRPVPNVDLRLVDESGNDVASGNVGEVVYRGPTVFQGYWRDPEATSAAFADGWFHSGDLARIDEDGCLWLVDRKKDVIISGGENIASLEVEQAVAANPKVAEVAVIGVPHPRWVETPLAVVVPVNGGDPPTLEELVTTCQQQLASFKKPTALVIVNHLPRNAGGKVLKRELRQRYGRPPVVKD